ncbi:MAG TPA: MFS transporter [Anaerolineales bacterium]|nr:MFS transporter [Anaerolineales bacterium]
MVRILPLANRNFRLLWLGENISLLGDQFYFIALPWLVFQMTDSALAFGTILMVAGIPRAVLMLVGGVMTDRISPRSVMIVSNLFRLIITLLLTLIVAAQASELWMLYVTAFCFGSVDAFFHPAYRSIIPFIVDEDNLQASNSLMQAAAQLVQIVGPGVAGIVVRSVGAALSFAFDALTFLFTSILLWMMRPAAIPGSPTKPAVTSKQAGILADISEMLIYIRHDKLLTTLILVVAAVNLFFVGPLIVGSAALSQIRFVQGSVAYGAMLSAFAIGALAGTLTAGAVHLKETGVVSLLLVAAEGVLMIGIGYTLSLAFTCGLWLLTGFGAGFGSLNLITLTQTRVAKPMMGRFMSLLALTEVGLTPISNALAGLLADWNATALFVLAGACLTITGLLAAMNGNIRSSATQSPQPKS